MLQCATNLLLQLLNYYQPIESTTVLLGLYGSLCVYDSVVVPGLRIQPDLAEPHIRQTGKEPHITTIQPDRTAYRQKGSRK